MDAKTMWKTVGAVTFGALVLGSADLVLAQDDKATAEAKAIFLDGGGDKAGRPAMRFNVLLTRGDSKPQRVRSGYAFRNRDKMLFEFEVNKPQYVYVLNRTIGGDPDRNQRYSGTKGINVVRDEDRRDTSGSRSDRYKLLFPTRDTGTSNRLAANRVHTIPYDGKTHFVMDSKPGIEKLYVVLSSEPIRIERYFDLDGGALRAGKGEAVKTVPAEGEEEGEEAESEDTLDDLNKALSEWADNAEVAEAKGIAVESYGVSQNPARPMMIEVDLNHFAR